MNRREFPGLTFRGANIPTNASSSHIASMKKQIQEDIDKINSD
jgi:hypothetical protein